MNIIAELEKEELSKLARAKGTTSFGPGDTLKVNVKVIEISVEEKSGKVKTRDLGGSANTAEFTKAIIDAMT